MENVFLNIFAFLILLNDSIGTFLLRGIFFYFCGYFDYFNNCFLNIFLLFQSAIQSINLILWNFGIDTLGIGSIYSSKTFLLFQHGNISMDILTWECYNKEKCKLVHFSSVRRTQIGNQTRYLFERTYKP